MATKIQLTPQTKLPIAYSLYAALDLHCGHSLLGGMDHDGNLRDKCRFPTDAEHLTEAVRGLGGPGAGVCLTMEASSLTRWAAGLVRPLVDRLVICEPRHNRLVNANPNKDDEEDVDNMCLLLRVNKLHEVWMGDDRARQIHRELVYELLNWRAGGYAHRSRARGAARAQWQGREEPRGAGGPGDDRAPGVLVEAA